MIENRELYDADPEVWEKYADPECLQCGGVGSINEPGDWVPYGSTWAMLPGGAVMCDCIDLQAAAADGWVLD